MSIKPGLQYDHSIASVVGRPTIKLSGGFDSSQQQATHALVFMLCGISSKWKQTIAYEFTANSFCSQEIVQIITAIIQKANDIGIKIKAVISDMGPQNRSWWRIMNITVGKHSKINNYTTHPCSNEEKLFIMPDSVHVYKNVACSLTAGNKFYLDDTLVRLYNLPHNEISMKPIREVHNLEKNDSLKLCPHLKENAINPSHFDKMNVSLSIALLNNNVAAAISYHIGNGRIENIHKTTAWFLTIMYKWFKIMTSRYIKLALSHIDENVYKDNIIFLKDFIKIIKGITVGDGKWKPFQSGLILCTQTALDLQAEYLEKENFKFLLLGRFTQDALENLFSIIRGRKSVPDAREFKYTLRLVCLSQFKANINRGNYSTVDSDHIIQYCKEIKNCDLKNTSSEVQSQQSIEDLWDTGIYESLLGNETDLSDVIQTALYHLTGALLYKIKKNFKVCDHCFNAVVTNCANDLNNNICSFSRLREYKENILTFPTMDIYNIIYKCELLFRKNETKLILNELKVIQFVQMFLQQYPANFIPSCHNIIYKLIKTFVIARIHFSLKKKTINEIKTVNSSRSVAMKAYVSKPKHNK
ncbi:PREDICTED: uncharacterized protein LOC105570767 isoform X2 [Vollenhovia emeryi]|nr:PREDICTED: uncharacterized protein LOC105570767 isoform X2 [Vollenhovia emeryi]